MHNRGKLWVVLVTFGVMASIIMWSDSMRDYFGQAEPSRLVYLDVDHPLEDGLPAKPLASEDQKLLDAIRSGAPSRRLAPINARVDRVWHAIPGYNGLEVDVDQSFSWSKQHDGQLIWMFREVEPDISLEQLGPHPVFRGNPAKPMVALMVNVAWGDDYLPAILNALERAHVKATFFLDGTWLQKHMQTAQSIVDAGHELGNHAFTHPDMSSLDASAARLEISRTEDLLKQVGYRNRLFAPPSGDYDQETVDIAHQLGLKTILWTVDTLDWKKPTPAWIVQRIDAQVEPGSLILMHPTISASKALPEVIETIKRKGYAFGTVSGLLSSKRVESVESSVQF